MGLRRDSVPFTSDLRPQAPRLLQTFQREVDVEQPEYDDKYFVERDLQLDISEYSRQGKEAGLVLIFNQESFKNPNFDRRGSRRDVIEIISCFGRLGFNIQKDYIFSNLKTQEIKDKLEELSFKNLSDYNCLIVFFLSHGSSNNKLLTYDGTIQADDLWKQLGQCLKGRPKMFIIEACKGHLVSQLDTTGEEPFETLLVPPSTFQPSGLYNDMIVLYSSTEGNVSVLTDNGSWLIQELCRNFYSYGRRDDVISLIIRTTKCICRNYFDTLESNKVVKQIPVFVSTLTKKFFLNSNRDRSVLINIHKRYNDLDDYINQISAQVDKIQKRLREKRNNNF